MLGGMIDGRHFKLCGGWQCLLESGTLGGKIFIGNFFFILTGLNGSYGSWQGHITYCDVICIPDN